jgi:hypothetical protein
MPLVSLPLLSVLSLVGCKRDEPEEVIVAPDFVVTSPAPGAFVDAGTLAVVGRSPGLSNVTVNGVPALDQGGLFTVDVPAARGIVPLEFVGQDRNGNTWKERFSVIAGDFAPAEGPLEDALVLRLNQRGLDDIAELISGLLVPEELLYSLVANNPVYNLYLDSVWPLDDTNVDVFVSVLQFDPLVVRAEPRAEDLHLDVRLPNLYVELQTFGTIPLLNNTDGDRIIMSAEEVHIEVDVKLDVGPDGAVTARLIDPSVQMPGFEITWEYLWDGVDWVVDLFLDLQTLIEDGMVGALETSVPPLLEGAFGALNDRFELELLGSTFGLRLQLDAISADPDGVAFSAHMAIDAPSQLVREDGGWLTSANKGKPDPSRTAPISAALSDDFLNRALYEMWAANLISLRLSTDDGTLDPFLLGALGATQGTISVMAGLPPVVVERDGQLVAELGEIALRLETPGGENGDFLDVVLSGQSEIDLTIIDNELRLSIGQPDLQFAVVDSDWGGSNNTITTLLEQQLPLDVILLLLGDFAFPLPDLGFTISEATAERDISGVHTDFEISL